MSWSEAQLRILRALGHEPFMRAGARPAALAEAASSTSAATPARAASAAVGEAATAALALAIARAAGGRELPELALDFERLRREPALKRALWPQLRRLRRGH